MVVEVRGHAFKRQTAQQSSCGVEAVDYSKPVCGLLSPVAELKLPSL